MKFTNLVKGRAAETLVKTLLESVGYRVVSFGVEEQLREIKLLEAEEYKTLNLPKQIRKMPDLIVTDKDLERFWVVEVKYRSKLNKKTIASLYSELQEQASLWGNNIYTIIIRGDLQVDGWICHSELVRVIHSIELENLKDEQLLNHPDTETFSNVAWGKLTALHYIFDAFNFESSRDATKEEKKASRENSYNASVLAAFMVKYLSSVSESTDDKTSS